MPADAAPLNEEEQKLFDQMAKDDGQTKPEPKPETKVEAKVEAKAETKTEVKAEAKPEQPMIPKAALDEARSQNKELRSELKSLKDLVAEGDKKLQGFVDKLAKQAEAPAPKFEDDPAGALKHENDNLKKSLDEIRSRLEKQDQAAQATGEVSKHKSAVDAKEAVFAKEHPDYWDASTHLTDVWRDEFLEAGFDAAEVPKLVFGKAIGITHKAIQAGKDPAEAVYKMAKRVGFTGKKEEAKTEEKAKSDGESKLKAIEKGQELAKSGGGGTGPDDASISSLAQMDNEQLDRLVADKDWWAKNIKRSPLH
jgi:hypothetical protein